MRAQHTSRLQPAVVHFAAPVIKPGFSSNHLSAICANAPHQGQDRL